MKRVLGACSVLVVMSTACASEPHARGAASTSEPSAVTGDSGELDGGAASASPDAGPARAVDVADVAPLPPREERDASGKVNDAPDAAADAHAQEADAAATTPSQAPLDASCLSGLGDYKQQGKLRFKTERLEDVPIEVRIPEVLAGCKLPVLHFGNGTGASCSSYTTILDHLASHGFLTICTENPNTGSGSACMRALETAYERYPALAGDVVASAGHEQGGDGAFMCVALAEQKWGKSKRYAAHGSAAGGAGGDPDRAAVYAKIASPVFMQSASDDVLVPASWIRRAFDLMSDSTEVYWYEAQGAPHIPVPARWMQESLVAWFRWKLLADAQACAYFKQMPDGSDWKLSAKQAERACE